MHTKLNKIIKLAILGLSCFSSAQTLAATSDVKISFIEINDLHANLVSHKDQVMNADGTVKVANRGGMARMATLIKKARTANPNTVVMNIGDTFHGGVEAFYTLGNAVADPLNAMGIDVGVAGNWDFYFTPAITRLRYGRITGLEQDRIERSMPMFAEFFPIKRPNFPNLGANVKDFTDIFMPKDFFDPTTIITYQGVKVGFIGFTSDIVEQMHPLLAEGMDFAYGIEEHKNLLIKHARDLRSQGADIVVLMSELGIHKDIALSRALADMKAKGLLEAGLLDMVFSAHTHELTRSMITTAEDGSALYAPVVESGGDAYLGQLDVTMKYVNTTGRLRNKEDNWKISSKSWKILDVNESVAEDPTVKSLVTAARASFLPAADGSFRPIRALPFMFQMLKEPINTKIGHIDAGNIAHQGDMLSGVLNRTNANGNNSTFNEAFTHMLLDVSLNPNNGLPDGNVAISPGFRMGGTLPEAGFLMENGAIATGDITLEDAYRFFPMYYGAAMGEITGADLKRRVEDAMKHTYSSDAFNHGGGWSEGVAGVNVTVNLRNGDPTGLYIPGDDPSTFTPSQLSRLVALKYESGADVKDSDVVKVVGCSRLPIDYKGTLCGQPGYSNVQRITDNNGMIELGVPGETYEGSTYEIASNGTIIAIGPRPATMIDLFVDNLKTGYQLKTTGTAVHDISNFPVFPAAPYVQPLQGAGGYIQAAPSEDPCGYFKWKCLPGQPL